MIGQAGVSVGVVTADSTSIGHADIAGEVLEGVWKVENSITTKVTSPTHTTSTKANHLAQHQPRRLSTEHANDSGTRYLASRSKL